MTTITNETQYQQALQRAYELMQADLAEPVPGEPDELTELSIEIEKYEAVYYPLPRRTQSKWFGWLPLPKLRLPELFSVKPHPA